MSRVFFRALIRAKHKTGDLREWTLTDYFETLEDAETHFDDFDVIWPVKENADGSVMAVEHFRMNGGRLW